MIYQLSNEYYVRSLQVSDVDGPYPLWFEDQDVCKYNSHGKFFKNKAYFEEFIKSLNGQDKVVWAICHDKDGHIGNISLQSLDFINRNGEFAILIGDRKHWGKAIGKLAGRKLIDHGFYKLNLHRIYCGTADTNQGMKNLALSLGMKEEGRRKQHLYLDGAWVDVVEFGIIKKEDYLSIQ